MTSEQQQPDDVAPATRVQAIYLALMELFQALGGNPGAVGLPSDLTGELGAADPDIAQQLSRVILAEIESREGMPLADLSADTVKQYTVQLAQSAQQAQQEATLAGTTGNGEPAGGMPN